MNRTRSSFVLGGLLLIVLSLGAASSAAPAPATRVSATITVSSAVADGDVMRVKGKLGSRKAVCRGSRPVKLGLRTTERLWPTDRATVDRKGGWSLRMDISELPHDEPGFGAFKWLEVSLPKKVVRSQGRRIVCQSEKARAVYTRLLITSVRGSDQTGGAAIIDGWVYTWASKCSGRTITVRNLSDGTSLGSPTPDNPDWSAGTGWTLTPPGTANASSDKYRAVAPAKRITLGGKAVQCVKGVAPYPS